MGFPPSSPQEPRPPLPAPYEPPWRRLVSDLEALIASGRLKARELWRLNREGSLPRPAVWPIEMAALFWPSMAALGFALLLLVVLWLPGRWAGGSGPIASPGDLPAVLAPGGDTSGSMADEGVSPQPSRQEASGPDRGPGAADPSLATKPRPDPDSDRRAARGAGRQGSDPGGSDASGSAGPPGTAPSQSGDPKAAPEGGRPLAIPVEGNITATSAEPQPSLPTLVELLGEEPPPWVLGLEQHPDAALLTLRLGGGFGELPAAKRRQLAELWLARSRELGYERLELVDSSGRLLGRPARVGSGMILLDAAFPPP